MKILIQTENILAFCKIYLFSLFTCYMSLKIMNQMKKDKMTNLKLFISIIFVASIYIYMKDKVDILYRIITLIFILSFIITIATKKIIGYSIIITTISLTINNILFFISSAISMLINSMFGIKDKNIIIVGIATIYIILVHLMLKIKKFKNGFSFLNKNLDNEYFGMLLFNISIIILFLVILLSNYIEVKTGNIGVVIIMFAIIMFITIQKSLQLYYKQKLLVQELNETKEELENTKKELKQVEEENLEFSKKSHTLAHRQKSLEHKIQELVTKTEISTEEAGEVKDRLKEIEKDLYKETATVELSKTEISEIDDMLKYMQSECIKNKIEFELQLAGNIHYMTNNLISKEDLEILLADHIKDAIIAVNHTDNINRSILVRLGEIDGLYSLYIYDSGIEFEIETLKNLGKRPSTTHADEGGTGMGFMNTFDTLRKYKASLTINELSKPNKDNYTKVIIFKFDKKNDFKIISYRQEELS